MAEDFGFVPDPRKKDKEEDFGFIPDDPASQTKREYVEKGGKPEDVYSPERLQTLVEQGPAALIAEPPMRRDDGSIAGPTIPTKEALDKGLIEKRAEPAVEKAMDQGVDTVSSGFDKEKGVGFAVGRDKKGEVVRVEEKPDDFGFVPDPKPKRGLQPMSEYQRPEQPTNPDDPSFAGALVRGAARSAIPTAAGIAGGAATGAIAGAALTGPAAPAGALIGGLIGGIGAAYGAEKLQDFALDKFLAPETKKAIDEQFAKDTEKQPVASFVGQVAPSFALFRPSPSNLAKAGSFAKQVLAGDITKEALESPAVREQVSNLVNVGFGAGTQAGLEAFGQIQNGNFDPLRLGASVVLGALQTEPTALGRRVITQPMQRLDETIRNRGQAKDVATTEPQTESVQPDAQAKTEQAQGPKSSIEQEINQLSSEYKDERRQAFEVPQEQKEAPESMLAKEQIDGVERPDYDILDFIKENGGILSKTNAIRQKNMQLYGRPTAPSKRLITDTGVAEYDGMPELKGGYQTQIAGKLAVDDMANLAFNSEYGFGDGTSGGLWAEVGKAIDKRQKAKESEKQLGVANRQDRTFIKDVLKPKDNRKFVQASDLNIGDTLKAPKADFKVTDIDPEDFRVTLTDGDEYGVQTVKENTALFTTEKTPRQAKQGQVPPSEPPPPTKTTSLVPEPSPEPTQRPVIGKVKDFVDNFRRTFQDKFVDVENLQKRITKGKTQLPDVVNIKQAEELYHGRVGERLTEFDEGQVRPLVEELGKAGVPMDVFERYATAKHAKERNAVIAERNPSKPDGGSGMSNAEADRILNGGIPKDVQAKIEPVRQKLLELNRGTLNNLLEGGLINQDTHDLLTKRYKDYVPLRGKEGVEGGTEYEGARITGTGSGLDVRGRDIMTAGGRKSQATDLIAYAVSQHMDSIVRSEKNRVLQTASRFALAYPDNGVIENLKPSEVMKTITYAEDGQTKYARVVDPRLADAPDIVAYKEDGVAKYLRINDPKLADIMKNRASPVLGSFVEKLGSLNRYFAFINTQASPEFVISNFARDLQTALVNINQNDAKGLATDLVKNVPSSLRATFRAELGTPDKNNRMDLFYNEFKQEGGRMTFFGLRDFATLQKQIQAEVARGGSNSATKVFGKALDFVGKANSAVENATRLATYATLRERGYTPKQSAYAARNITVNFTRKGTAGPLLNSFYLFFNANIQGSARIIQALATSKKAQRIMLGVMVFGFFRDILNRILGGEDETGIPLYDKIPEYTRRQNFVLMNPLRQGTGEYFKFPMPYGYSVFDYAGQLMASVMPRETLGGGMNPSKAAFRLSMAAVDNFNPIGGSYHILQAISPTIMTPFTDLALNMDFSGRPIIPTPNPFDPTPPPDSQRYWNNVGPVSKWVTEKINEITGGSKARAGAIDVSPETLDYGLEFLTGAVGKFGERLVNLPFRGMAAAQGDLPLEDLVGEIPMYRKLSGRVPSYVDISRYQEMRSEVLKISEELKIAQKEGERAKAIEISREAQPELRMVPLIKSTEQRLKELRSERRKLQENYKRTENEAILNRIRANKERQKELMIRALGRYNSSVDDKI